MSLEKEEELLEILRGVPFLGTTKIEKKMGISRRYVRKIVDSLYLKKKIAITGPGRNPLYPWLTMRCSETRRHPTCKRSQGLRFAVT